MSDMEDFRFKSHVLLVDLDAATSKMMMLVASGGSQARSGLSLLKSIITPMRHGEISSGLLKQLRKVATNTACFR
jgi:hypothetical protein